MGPAWLSEDADSKSLRETNRLLSFRAARMPSDRGAVTHLRRKRWLASTTFRARLPECVPLYHVKAVSPKDRPTCGIIMTKDQAVELASYILVVRGASNAKGLSYVTKRPKECTVTVIRGIK